VRLPEIAKHGTAAAAASAAAAVASCSHPFKCASWICGSSDLRSSKAHSIGITHQALDTAAACRAAGGEGGEAQRQGPTAIESPPLFLHPCIECREGTADE
jgi:hypothetical protein